ncbi:MAG TPA: rhamnulokinase family protein [Candidatus Sulfotelmatobacter sp.]|jgi:rhamnulokinase|nr:rhamnulokinase family protein [Candidatus Sulfotelmatobacter sp.]
MPENSAKPYLAFDFGAESGRAVLAHLQSGTLTTEEVHRFPNEPVEYGGSLHWDVARLWFEVRKAFAALDNVELAGIGVDTWGVDYALLGERGELLQNPYHYRDRRTEGVMDEVFRRVSKEDIYGATGIQFMPINTLYQLFAEHRDSPKVVDAAKHLVTIPDLFNYWLTGNAVCEFTNATTTQMVDPVKRAWASDLMQNLGLPTNLPAPIVEPGAIVGSLLPGIARDSRFAGTTVIAPACHDTGSAVAAISAREGTAFLSSGTWSLVGTELDSPVITSDALRLNFTNEGGVNGTTRLLKNVMGLWILQGCRQSWSARGVSHDYRELMELAAREPSFRHLVDPDDESFLRPSDMAAAINEFCDRTHQPSPQAPGAYVRAIFESLAFKYRLVLRNLEQVSGKHFEQIRIIGGGSKNRLLNQLTADATGKRVLAGPAEATALGNVAIQILATGGATSLQEVRAIVDRSFPTEIFEPIETDKWDQQAERFEQYCESIYARN